MTTPANAYITDVAYPAHFHREMMPLWLHATLTGIGIDAPSIERPFTWLELGCGSAVNLLAAAARYPHSVFVGIDLSEREIEQARQWAKACALENVHFLCANFEALSPEGVLPRLLGNEWRQAQVSAFDYIVSHGVYSWVNVQTRHAMHAIIGQYLKPKGIAYLAYNCQPGAATFAATQRLMYLNAQRLGGAHADHIHNSLDLALTVAQGGAGYFVEQPAAWRELERIRHMDTAYLAHEFFNRNWSALHVSDVMADLTQSNCVYAGSATPIENIDAFSLPTKLRNLVSHMHHQGIGIAQIETTKDIARNQTMRRDLYQKLPQASTAAPEKSPIQLSAQEHRAKLMKQRVALLPAAQTAGKRDISIRIPTRIGPVELPAGHVQPIVQKLRNGSQTYAELTRLEPYCTAPGSLNPVLQTLAWAGWLQFAAAEQDHAQTNAIAQRLQQLRNIFIAANQPDLASQI
ncbi:methyltransferase domain-containing protein [Lampropedia puyangensis]|uniref:Methyltransferase domain-containing protein n=1 Tax=Lampropedia puyangensis TaxID=1330072 RepID=A0A4S8ESU0_9BURK|nr:class I SAM-dependent methyltransferase [Lampropedia puyangensis]THT97949.1 methyltransferase domain-containing protein [Lampropedia puyangensis]